MESTNKVQKSYPQSVVKKLSEEPKTVRLQLLIDANVKVTGIHSGREYAFPMAGSTQDVDERDVEWMLNKRQGSRQCCGGSDQGNQIFALA